MKASAFIVHGINDWNVKTIHSHLFWKEMEKYNIPKKMILHQGDHIYIPEIKGIDLRKAFDIYYSSKLAEQISNDSYGIENMDAKYLAEDLIENEPDLF